ncbi:type 1 periplasmic binding fold superfamily protein [Lentiprolixibacter aurantiacus]|uniref:Type 1 periplasmic binding fold superfamily protein n=1 Tax=Lentiprolixibacter aurantiacus TaxID=2993939 RepID=A0AAE3SNW0_9FLAO|nr:type 1 periplasmic binding fold superfamily protein [Lentiprolixibacter aurantiacus]MCX2718877.1 type 1 periplasmic binding fold superfamily protein [Lentiprolixibacter aurantiacus]
MKTLRTILSFAIVGALFVSCSNDDDAPAPVNEEELITTMIITLSPQGGGTVVTLQSEDLDGDGPGAPEIDISGPLDASTTYTGTIQLLNKTENPAEDITLEVQAEDEEHQFFYEVTGAITDVTYTDQDGNGNPVGLSFELTTGAAGAATLQATLRHEPKKPNDGTLADAGGETDISQPFNITVQ